MNGMSIFKSRFAIGDPVHIDGHQDITAVVTALCFRSVDSDEVNVEVSWLHNGVNQVTWVPDWRLILVPEE